MSSPDTNPRLTLPNDEELSQVLTPKLPAWCALNGWHFVAVAGVALFFAYHSYLHLFYSDLWGHVAYGEWILQHQQLPTEEPFVPLAAGVPVIATAWGGQVLLALAVRTGDHEWLSHLFAITVWVSYLILARAFWFRTRHGGVALLGAFVAWCISWGRHAIIRPEIFGVLCFFTLIWLLARGRVEFGATADDLGAKKLRGRVTLVGIGVVFAAWANLHGSAIVGVVYLGCYLWGRSVELLWRHRNWSSFWTDSDWQFWFRATLIAVLGMCCNPYGIDLFIHTLLFANHPNLKDIIEWFPLTMDSPTGITVGASWVLAAVLLRYSRVTMRAGDVCVLGFFIWAVSTKIRMVAWYSPVLMWVLAPHLADVLVRVEFDRRRRELLPILSPTSFRWSAIVVLLAWVTVCFTPISRLVLGNGKPREERQLYSKGTPLELTRYLREHPPQGLVCVPQWWGDWLAWQGPPKMNVMATTNSVHILPPQVWNDYLNIGRTQVSAEMLLTRYRANTVVACKKMQQGLAQWISSSPAWEVTYEDEDGLVAIRRSALPIPKPEDACSHESNSEPREEPAEQPAAT
ncbi:MAG: hypothetical protein DWI21_10300 [Planctomycetota bacterium]|nr:MAG: hypothetical protein DWI21_10300 [Planctomycetota bacterium]